ncbi:hypothetical protein GCM10009784_01420 [Arthrobacter parietis]|uniref:Uncharacterized protein n=2 Tax=Arthrobacter TaxID=1663 RepID=A0ABP5ME00_9MICC
MMCGDTWYMKRSQVHTWLITAASAGAVVAVGVAMIGSLRGPAPENLGPAVGVTDTQVPAPPGTPSPSPTQTPTPASTAAPSVSPSEVPAPPAPEPSAEATVEPTEAASPPPAVVPAPPPVIQDDDDDRGRGRGGDDGIEDDGEVDDD